MPRERPVDTYLSARVLDGISQAILVIDRHGRVVAANRAFHRLCGLGESETAGIELSALAHRHADSPLLAQIAAAARGGAGQPGSAALGGDHATAIECSELADGTRVLAFAARDGKAAFLSRMSHELRTPLNAVIGFADIIKGQLFGPIGSGKYIEYAEEIRRSGHGLLSIITTIIDIARLESGEFMLREEDTDLAALVRDSAERLRDAAAPGGVTIELDLPGELPLARVDPRALQQAVTNIVSNGVKFSPPGGTVVVSAVLLQRGPDAGGVEIAVADPGTGLAPAQVARLGEAFFQADDGLVRKHEGAGLGLALTKALVALHNGRLDVHSTPGAGTRVGIVLPGARLLQPAR